MARPILMPKPGQMTEACTVTSWLKHEGEAVARGDILFEIETDKASMDVEAFEVGTLLRIVVAEGQEAPVNAVVAWIGEPGEVIPEAAAAPSDDPLDRQWLVISPRASRIAAELDVDPRGVRGSGPDGRIVEADIRAAARGSVPMEATTAEPKSEPESEPEVEPQPLSRMRRAIADRLTLSVTTIPHFSVTVAVDMTGLLELRAELRRDGSPIAITDFVHAATARTLVELPTLNARTDGRLVWSRSRVHLGMAVSVPGGLLVPVIRDAHLRTLAELHDAAASLVEGARQGSLGPDQLSGSTFTVSNMGMLGVEQFSAIVNPGESGILAVSSIQPTAVAIGEGLAVRQVMRLTLSADHRLVDGEMGARFVNGVRRRLEDVAGFRAALGSE